MYPRPFVEYLIYFHCYRDYFECHEVLEEYWKEEQQSNRVWVGFIQFAVAMYHYRRGNIIGAKKQLFSATKIIQNEKKQVEQLGLNFSKFLHLMLEKQQDINNQIAYTPMQIPIKDLQLLHECEQVSKSKGVLWSQENIVMEDKIIHKHKLRDRSQIIADRESRLKNRKNN